MTTQANQNEAPRFILSGGGTGGHIFPAVAIAKALKKTYPNASILFVGAKGKMEMEKVPKEGFEIIGLPIEGLKRSLSPRNIIVLFKTIQSFIKARHILKTFKPNVVIGTGGYASLPICFMSAQSGIPTLLQEQNGFAGLTNRLVAERATHICTGFPDMGKFFPKGNWTFTGNPVRQNIIDLPARSNSETQKQARMKFGLHPDLPVLFITGGSLGAKTLNQSVFNNLETLAEAGVQIIWQMGQPFAASHAEKIHTVLTQNTRLFASPGAPRVFHAPFVYDIDEAYLACDAVISRAGAISISEIGIVQKPAILVPSPNVTDDHQTQNALILSGLGAALLVSDSNAPNTLISEGIALIKDTKKRAEMQEKLKSIGKPNATETIVQLIISCLKSKP